MKDIKTNWTTLGEVCEDPQYGWTTSAAKSGKVKLLRTTDITSGKIDWDNVPYCKDTPDNVGKYLLKNNDIVISRAGSIGVSYIVKNPEKAVFASYLIRFTPKKDVNADYVSLFLKSPLYWRQVEEASLGIAIPNINATKLKGFKLPIPSLQKQDEIFKEIETQFARLDEGVAALKKAQANLKRYRAAVLKAACEGKLVPTEAELARKEGRCYETGEQLLKRILAERKKKWEEENKGKSNKKYVEPKGPDVSKLPKLPKGWVWATVEQIGVTTTGFTPTKKHAKYFGGNIPFFKPTDLDAGYNVVEYRDSLTKAGAEQGRILPALTILVTCIGATIGKTGLTRVNCTTNQQINALTVNESVLLPQYIYWLVASPFGQNQIINNASSTTLPILNKSRFESLLVKLPPYAEQKRIVEEIEKQVNIIDKQVEISNITMFHAASLRSSTLNKAFES